MALSFSSSTAVRRALAAVRFLTLNVGNQRFLQLDEALLDARCNARELFQEVRFLLFSTFSVPAFSFRDRPSSSSSSTMAPPHSPSLSSPAPKPA
jgi:hypothetical protein